MEDHCVPWFLHITHFVVTTELALACGVCVYTLYFTSMGVMYSVYTFFTDLSPHKSAGHEI